MAGIDGVVQCDVLVVGGGPGGSTVAMQLQRAGRHVILLEKDHHPRFHIGESLLPANLPIFERIGVAEDVRALGVHKPGADFLDAAGNHQTFRFDRALGATPPHAYHVKREEFDSMLFEHARKSGVDAREGVKVERLELGGIGAVSAQARDRDGNVLSVCAKYLVDASGRDTLLGNQLKVKQRNVKHQSAAMFAHYRGVQLREGEDAGNISIYRFDAGWCWIIPLRDGVVSVGCVCRPEYLKLRRGDNAGFFLDTLKRMPVAWQRIEAAERVSDIRVTGNYAYACTQMAGPGWIMVGDACAFVDPVFSSGVYLAMDSAERAAAMIDTVLTQPQREASLQSAYVKRIQRGLQVFSWFIYRFNSPAMRKMFASPRNTWQVEQGVISMLAGDVYDDARVMRRITVFKIIYAITSLGDVRRGISEWLARRRQPRIDIGGDSSPHSR